MSLSRRSTFFTLSAAAIVAMAGPAFAGPNLLVNPDFESGNTGFTSGYTFANFIDPQGLYSVASNPATVFGASTSFGDHTTGHGLMGLFNGSATPNTVAWQETVTVTAGTTYEFSGWISTPCKSGTFNQNAIDLHPADTKFVVNGLQIGTFALPSPTDDGTWGKFSALWQSGASTTATIQLFITRTDASGNDITLDDLSFSSVPEPGTLGALSVGSILMLRRRRK